MTVLPRKNTYIVSVIKLFKSLETFLCLSFAYKGIALMVPKEESNKSVWFLESISDS